MIEMGGSDRTLNARKAKSVFIGFMGCLGQMVALGAGIFAGYGFTERVPLLFCPPHHNETDFRAPNGPGLLISYDVGACRKP